MFPALRRVHMPMARGRERHHDVKPTVRQHLLFGLLQTQSVYSDFQHKINSGSKFYFAI